MQRQRDTKTLGGAGKCVCACMLRKGGGGGGGGVVGGGGNLK